MAANNYSLATGSTGAERLAVLHAAMWPSTRHILEQAELRQGMSFLDVGCGIGLVTASATEMGVTAMGVDLDEGFIETARKAHPQISFKVQSVDELTSLNQRYDFVYARYLLSHLKNPAAAVQGMISATKAGGTLVLEDVDFGYAIPRADCLRRYDDLYRAVVRVRGGDALLGRHLAKMLTDAGLVDIHERVQLTLAEGESRRLTSMTLSGIAGSILKEGLAEEQELNRLYNDIYQLENDPDVEIGVAPTYQVWGRIPT